MRSNIRLLVVLTTLFLSLGYISSIEFNQTVLPVHAASPVITLRGAFATGWNGTNPGPTITVTRGDTITVNLVSADGAPHTFIIDVAHAGIVGNPNCSVDKCSSQFTSTTSFTFTADMAADMYTYYCLIHLQHMYGSIMVQSSNGATPDFTTAANPSTLTLAQGSSGSVTLSLTSVNGFSGAVGLTATVSSSGPQVSLGSMSVTLPPNGSASVTVTISTASGGYYSTPTATGSYTVTVSETSGSLSHSTTIPVNVGSTSSSTPSMPPAYRGMTDPGLLTLAVALILVVVAAIAATVLVRRRARP